jgi:hypothetical protein
MTPESRKKFNTLMGSFLIFLALVCFGLAAYMIFVPAQEKPAPLPTVAAISKQPCIEGLTALGLTAISVGEDIQVTDRHAELPPLDRLKTASLGVSMCHMYLKTFCMGPACPDPSALSFTLTQNEQAANAGGSLAAPSPRPVPATPAAPDAAAPTPEAPPALPPPG